MTIERDSKVEKELYAPHFLNARREAWIILASWAICLAWTVGYCAFYAYDVAVEDLTVVWGMPGWVVWGVLAPWLAATVFSVCFGLFYMADDDLGKTATPGWEEDGQSGGSAE